MKSEMKTTLRGLTAALWVLLAGCGGGGSSNDGRGPSIPTPPGNPDNSLIEDYPSVNYLYFQGDDYNVLAADSSPTIRTYQAGTVSGSGATAMEFPTAQVILRPKVALSSRSVTSAYSVLVTASEFWYLAPDEATVRRLSTLTGKICPDRSKTYFHGITRANAGIMTALAGADGLCSTADDEFWAIPLTATANEPAQAINAAVYEGTPLLDSEMRHLGFLRAGSGQPLELYDTQGNLLQTLLGPVDGPVQPVRYVDGGRAVLIVGSSLYLIDTTEMVQPGYSLPTPVYTASTLLDSDQIRLDEDRVYLTDGNRLVGIAHDGSVTFDRTFPYDTLAFESTSVFTTTYIVLYGRTDPTTDLLAIPKDPANSADLVVANDPIPRSAPGLQGPLYYATANYLYFSTEVLAEDDIGFQATVWHESASKLVSYNSYDAARWYFYQNHGEGGISDRALLLQAKPLTDPDDTTSRVTDRAYFVNPLLYIYPNPDNPDPAGQSDPATSTRNLKPGSVSSEAAGRIREMSHAQNGHLLFTLQSLAADPISLIYLTQSANMRRVSTSGPSVCERITSNDSSTTMDLCKKE